MELYHVLPHREFTESEQEQVDNLMMARIGE